MWRILEETGFLIERAFDNAGIFAGNPKNEEKKIDFSPQW